MRAAGVAHLFAALVNGLPLVHVELKKRGVLTASADAHALATGLLAALQGGYLLAKTARDVRPMRVVLDMAIAQVRAYSTESGSV